MKEQDFHLKRVLFICQGKSCSKKMDAQAAKAFFKSKIHESGMREQLRACASSCLDRCDFAPNIVVYPDATWYSEIETGDWDLIWKKLTESVS